MELEIFLNDEQDTLELGNFIGKIIKPSITIYLFGDLGSGKTLLSKGIAKGLGINEDDITSPTFTLINHYSLKNFDLYHLDLYRLNSLKEILNLGIEDFVDNNSIILIEWAEKLNNYKLTDNFINIKLEHLKSGRKCLISLSNEVIFNEFSKFKNKR
ncbi:MAG: tRNA (adenosine(37)-N6)-threonylcarbamoyltransferase complex ATPase subunit type 1 TsaE [Candidatus Sericytochromatia bacterium]|nr:MAG: tRNA (adenosine(37)-N6)-threonylcarbamoyltransferase complex ATPase subunit type 1 TsaE [Candidatus Sericytochromatia bacterium]